MAQYKASDFVEQKDPLEILKKSLAETIVLENKLVEQNKELQASFAQLSQGTSGKNAKELVELTNKLAAANKDLETTQKAKIVLEKSELKLLQDLETLKQKEIKTQKDSLDLTVKENKEKERQINLDKKQQKETEKEIGLINQLNEQNKKLRQEKASLGDASRKFTSEEIKRLKDINKQLDSNNAKLNELADKDGKRLKGIGRYTQGVTNAFSRMAGAVSAVYLASKLLIDAFVIMVKFNRQLSILESVSGATKEEMKALSDQAKQLGASTQFSATQILELDTELAKLGFTAKEIKDAVPGVQALAAATGYDLARSAELAGATMKIFNLEASQSGRIADVLAVSTAKSALSMEKLSTALPIVGTSARIAGDSMEMTIAKLGILSDRGMDASMSATAMRDIYSDLARKGITWNQAQSMILASTDKTKTAFDLFGKTGMNTAIILAENQKATEGLNDALITLDTTAADMAKIMLDNVAGDITIAKSAWEGFVLSIEDGKGGIALSIRSIIQLFTNLITTLTDTSDAAGILTEKLGKGGFFSFQLDPENYTALSEFAIKLRDLKKNIDSVGDSDKAAKSASAISALKMNIAGLNSELESTSSLSFLQKQFIEDKIKLAKIYLKEITDAETKRLQLAEKAAADKVLNDKIAADLLEASKEEADNFKTKEQLEKEKEANEKARNARKLLDSKMTATKNVDIYAKEEQAITDEIKKQDDQRLKDRKEYESELIDIAIESDDQRMARLKTEAESVRDIYLNLVTGITEEFTALIQDANATLQDYLKATIFAIIDTLEAAIVATQMKIILAQFESLAELNPVKLASATAALIGTKLAAAGAKALISKTLTNNKERKYADGTTYVTGQGTSRSDSVSAKLSVGEAVIPQHVNKVSPKLVHGLVEGKLTDSNAANFVSNNFNDGRIVSQLEKNNEIMRNLGFSFNIDGITYLRRGDGSVERITTSKFN